MVPQEDIIIDINAIKTGLKRMANKKAPGPDGVRGFWFKELISVHTLLVEALQSCISEGDVPDWMTTGRTVLIQKDPSKGNAPSNCRPIACLPLIWKLLTGSFATKIFNHLESNDLLPDEQRAAEKELEGRKTSS